MPKVSLPFWNAGQPFDPKIYPEDLADYEDNEAKAIEGKRISGFVKAKAAFVGRVLGREPQPATTASATVTPGQPVVTSTASSGILLTAPQVNQAWKALWRAATSLEDDAPLANGGASSPPSPSPA